MAGVIKILIMLKILTLHEILKSACIIYVPLFIYYTHKQTEKLNPSLFCFPLSYCSIRITGLGLLQISYCSIRVDINLTANEYIEIAMEL